MFYQIDVNMIKLCLFHGIYSETVRRQAGQAGCHQWHSHGEGTIFGGTIFGDTIFGGTIFGDTIFGDTIHFRDATMAKQYETGLLPECERWLFNSVAKLGPVQEYHAGVNVHVVMSLWTHTHTHTHTHTVNKFLSGLDGMEGCLSPVMAATNRLDPA
eukprot:GHVR01041859.1.p1 GENE.GHVR01041859.1~~GHVR01041859.1.p1  ORF type:complete len:157 (+),score=52.76 GHVR01041859.1:153-623(+)